MARWQSAHTGNMVQASKATDRDDAVAVDSIAGHSICDSLQLLGERLEVAEASDLECIGFLVDLACHGVVRVDDRVGQVVCGLVLELVGGGAESAERQGCGIHVVVQAACKQECHTTTTAAVTASNDEEIKQQQGQRSHRFGKCSLVPVTLERKVEREEAIFAIAAEIGA